MDTTDKESLYHIFWEILRLHHCRAHTLLDEIGVYPGQPPMLFVLNEKDGQSQKELADRLNLTPATITVMLKRMERSNLVMRKQDEEDQRISRVYITEEGRELYKKTQQVMTNLNDECFENFTMEERVILRRLLMQMRDNLQEVNNLKSRQ